MNYSSRNCSRTTPNRDSGPLCSNSEKRLIRIINGSQHELGRLETESDILNFELSRDQQKLAVLVSGVDQGSGFLNSPSWKKRIRSP